MRIRAWAGWAALALLAAVVSAPLWVPLERFIERVEREASRQLGVPVTIGGMRLSLLPTPTLRIEQVQVGVDAMMSVREIRVTPKLSSLGDDTRVIEHLLISDVAIRPQAFSLLATRGAAQPGNRPGALQLRSIEVRNATLLLTQGSLSGIDGRIELSDGNAFRNALVTLQEGRWRAVLLPAEGSYRVALAVRNGTVPFGPRLRVGALDAEGVLSESGLRLEDISLAAYGGKAQASVSLTWQRGYRLRGRFDISGVALEALLSDLGSSARLTGRLSTKGAFQTEASEGDKLVRALRVDSDFEVREGRIRGVDLASAVKSLMGAAPQPGDTPFDVLKGHVLRDEQGAHWTRLEVESGLLTATGDVRVARDNSLEGDAKVSLKGTGALIGTPELAISGSTDAPRVYPSKASMAGAAVGTAILGPGLGTSLGMKAAELAKKLTRAGPARRPSPVEVAGRR